MNRREVSHSEVCITTATVRNPNGLHMRPTAAISKAAKEFTSSITVHHDGYLQADADAKSEMEMMTLCAVLGSSLRIVAIGLDAAAACEVLRRLIEKETEG